jgi:hypothetical protein
MYFIAWLGSITDRKYKRYFATAPSGVHPGTALRVTSGPAGDRSAAKAQMYLFQRAARFLVDAGVDGDLGDLQGSTEGRETPHDPSRPWGEI